MTSNNPVSLLRDLDARLRANARPLPGADSEAGTLWRGVGFRLANENLVAGMSDVVEVLTNPLTSRVPGAMPWVRGVANVRGRLVTVIELADFLEVQRAPRLRGQRALLVERGDLQVALQVDEVFGAKQLLEESRRADISSIPDVLAPYVSGCFVSAEERWTHFEVERVLQDPRFLSAAA